MNAIELLIYLIEKKQKDVFAAARRLPADKLDWQPGPNARSALNQLQEIATAGEYFAAAHRDRKIEWSPERMQEWMEARSKLTSIDELEHRCAANTANLVADMRKMSESDLTLPVQMPFPGEFNLADILAYHYWNMGYHEGQINYIGSLLEEAGS